MSQVFVTFREVLSQGSELKTILLCRVFSTAASTGLVPFLVFTLTGHFRISKGTAVLAVGLILLLPRFFGDTVGRTVDLWGAHRVLVASGVACALAYAGLAVIEASSSLGMVICLAILGIANVGILISYRAFIGKFADDKNLTIRFSWLSTAFNLGYVLGASFAGTLIAIGSYKDVFVAGATLSLISVVLIGPALKRYSKTSLAAPKFRPPPELQREGRASLRPYLFNVAITALLLQLIILTVAFYFDEIHDSAALVAVFFSFQSLALIFTLPLTGAAFREANTKNLYRSFVLATVILAGGVTAFTLVPPHNGVLAVIVLAIVTTLSQAIAMPTSDATITKLAGREQLGLAMGRAANASAIGSAIGMALAAIVMEFSHNPDQLRALWFAAGACVLLASVFLLFSPRASQEPSA